MSVIEIGVAIEIEKTGNQRLRCELKCRSLSVETKCEIKCSFRGRYQYRYRKKLETRDLGWMITMKSMKRHEKEQKTQDQKT